MLKPQTLILKHKIRNPEPGTRNPEPETRNPEPETLCRETLDPAVDREMCIYVYGTHARTHTHTHTHTHT